MWRRKLQAIRRGREERWPGVEDVHRRPVAAGTRGGRDAAKRRMNDSVDRIVAGEAIPFYMFLERAQIASEKTGKLLPGISRVHDIDSDWLLVDSELHHYLSLKNSVLDGDEREKVLCCENATMDAQTELLEMVIEHICRTYPLIYHYDPAERRIRIMRDDEQCAAEDSIGYSIDDFVTCPLELACRLVQEDFVLLRRDDDASGSYRLAASGICFSFGNLRERLGKRFGEVHGKVPGYGEFLQGPMDKLFERLCVEKPVSRTNWEFNFDSHLLHQGYEHSESSNYYAGITEDVQNVLNLRTEYQTLRRLPRNNEYVVFSIRTLMGPLKEIEGSPQAAAALLTNMRSIEFNQKMREYKGLSDEHFFNQICAYLESISVGE